MKGNTDLPIIYSVDEPDFDERVLAASHHRLVMVDFWAEWCPPCRMLTPVLEGLVQGYAGKIGLAEIEVDEGENMRVAGRYGLRGFPTVLLFRAGQEVDRFSGARSAGWVQSLIERHLA
ncbi:MAG: thioredoxin domain-containing protein [Betaproteobacteria bacterium]|nr:thioredoxin domain-containing protein [Betaproteobacteria bacterium]